MITSAIGPHIGANTHIQGQSITWANFNPRRSKNKAPKKSSECSLLLLIFWYFGYKFFAFNCSIQHDDLFKSADHRPFTQSIYKGAG